MQHNRMASVLSNGFVLKNETFCFAQKACQFPARAAEVLPEEMLVLSSSWGVWPPMAVFGPHQSLCLPQSSLSEPSSHISPLPLASLTVLLTVCFTFLHNTLGRNTFCKLWSPCNSKNAGEPSAWEMARNGMMCCVAAGILCLFPLLFCLSLSPYQARKCKRRNRCTSTPPPPHSEGNRAPRSLPFQCS